MSKAVAIICIVLGVVLLVGVAFGVYVLLESTNYFKAKPTDFWVTAQGKRYYSDTDGLVFSDTAVGVHYLVGWLSGKQGYTYKVVPSGDDFEYTVDGKTYNFLDIKDLTAAFEIVERQDGIIVKAYDKTVSDVLHTLHPNSDIDVLTLEQPCYKLVFTSADGKTVALTFRCTEAVDGIEIDPPSVIF